MIRVEDAAVTEELLDLKVVSIDDGVAAVVVTDTEDGVVTE